MMDKVLAPRQREELASFGEVVAEGPAKIDAENSRRMIRGADACMTCWGSVRITKEILDEAPDLKIVAHAAGSVKGIVSDEVYERDIVVTTAAPSIGIGVAEYALGLMITAGKRAFWLAEETSRGGWRSAEEIAKGVEMYDTTVGVIGAGFVGRHLLRLLRNFDCRVLLCDPYVSAEQARELHAEKVELDDLMRRSHIVTLHTPNIPATHHMINAANLKLMRDNALFINTARGACVDEAALIEELKTGRITACLDVTDPEPPAADSPLRSLPNVILSPHVAGSIAHNLKRQGVYAVREIRNVLSGKPPIHGVTKEMLAQMA